MLSRRCSCYSATHVIRCSLFEFHFMEIANHKFVFKKLLRAKFKFSSTKMFGLKNKVIII